MLTKHEDMNSIEVHNIFFLFSEFVSSEAGFYVYSILWILFFLAVIYIFLFFFCCLLASF